MIDTRILLQGLRGQGAGGRTNADEAPRSLRHDPILQGRIGNSRQTGRRPVAAGLSLARSPAFPAEVADGWAALPDTGETLEQLVGQAGRLPDIGRTSACGIAFDQLRSQVLRVIGERGWRRLGISGPRRGAGASFVTLGLAASIARIEYLRLLLIDLNLGDPSLQRHLGLTAPSVLGRALSGELPAIESVGRIGAGLAVLLNDRPMPDAAELLYSPEALDVLRVLDSALRPDLTVFDMPPLLADPTAQAALDHVDAVLLVADGTETTARDITDCEAMLKDQVPLLGVVLNRSEDQPDTRRHG